jgi:hypothetical protein
MNCIPGTKIKKPKVALVGEDGNAWSIIGRVARALKQAGCSKEVVDEYRAKSLGGDYSNVLATAMDYVDEGPDDEEEYEEEDEEEGGEAEDDDDEDNGTTSRQARRKGELAGTRIEQAFQFMQDEGLIARMDFWCCQSCAGCACTNEADKLIEEGSTDQDSIKGCAYYHAQDGDDFERGLDFYIAYGPMHSSAYGTIGLEDEEVGKIVCFCLQKAGVDFEWSGDGSERIQVKAESASSFKQSALPRAGGIR